MGAAERYGEGRHKGCVISSDAYLLTCMRYIELNPVRAHMATAPGDYRWSSYRSNAFGEIDDTLIAHSSYTELGLSAAARSRTYREFFRGAIADNEILAMRATVQTGTPLGDERFREMVERTLQRSVGQARRGRPPRE
jgi:putative transposase